jgi:hypothetical protein
MAERKIYKEQQQHHHQVVVVGDEQIQEKLLVSGCGCVYNPPIARTHIEPPAHVSRRTTADP